MRASRSSMRSRRRRAIRSRRSSSISTGRTRCSTSTSLAGAGAGAYETTKERDEAGARAAAGLERVVEPDRALERSDWWRAFYADVREDRAGLVRAALMDRLADAGESSRSPTGFGFSGVESRRSVGRRQRCVPRQSFVPVSARSRSTRSCSASTTMAGSQTPTRALAEPLPRTCAWRSVGQPSSVPGSSSCRSSCGPRSRGRTGSIAARPRSPPCVHTPPSEGSRCASKGLLPASEIRVLAERVGSPAFGCYLDLANPMRRGLDSPTEIRSLGELVRRVHVKDIRAAPGDVHPGLGPGRLCRMCASTRRDRVRRLADARDPAGATAARRAQPRLHALGLPRDRPGPRLAALRGVLARARSGRGGASS